MELQENYDYEHKTLDPNIGISAKKFLENRSYGTPKIQQILPSSGCALVWNTRVLILTNWKRQIEHLFFCTMMPLRSGMRRQKGNGWTLFEFPIVTGVDGTGKPLTKPATKWENYSREDVRNYFLYLILQGKYNFADLSITNVKVKTLLPANTVASKGSLLGYLNEGKGFDQGGAMYLKLVNNNDLAPIQINNKTTNRSGDMVLRMVWYMFTE
ncbi:hypothetical protein KUH03_28290 [Sphingobacterium sp. E70]|uniref:hypothetical protein n=1 Tax=Sphingobacterium sp. E70 TaxID=2853439 RepID=UPI00211C6E63|nr:hypothetical protein [Sphingobacterium sp. E70]ULT23107.1 hypothetical protein KUH03_28290 [Sphingobacterium sp. E70]